MNAIVLFAHGSRDPLWHAPIKAVAQRIQSANPSRIVRCAYLELTEPSLAEVTQELRALGCNQISITPLFLGIGKHAREDLPVLVQALAQQLPSMRITCAPPIGESDLLIDLVAQIAINNAGTPKP